jgi:hypothetical protein
MRDVSCHGWRLASRFERSCPGGHVRSASLLVFHPPRASRPCDGWFRSSQAAPHPDSPGVAGELFEGRINHEVTKVYEGHKDEKGLCVLRAGLCVFEVWSFRSSSVFCGEVARSSFRLSPALGPGGSGLFPLRLIRVFRCPTHCPCFRTAKTQRSRSFSNGQVHGGTKKLFASSASLRFNFVLVSWWFKRARANG